MHGVLLGRKQAGARENHFSCSLRIAADRNGKSNCSPDSDHVTWQALDAQCSMKAFKEASYRRAYLKLGTGYLGGEAETQAYCGKKAEAGNIKLASIRVL